MTFLRQKSNFTGTSFRD